MPLAARFGRTRIWGGWVAFLTVVVFALAGAATARAGTSMFVGAAEDDARTLNPLLAKSRMDLAAFAGFGTVRTTLTWSPGETAIAGDEEKGLANAVDAAQLDGIRIILSVYPRNWRAAPLSARARGQFASFAASAVRRFPAISDVIVGNEPNLNLFWMPQFGVSGDDAAARAYELLLAKTYDVLKAVSPDIDVIGGALASHGQDKPGSARPTHSPTAFILDLGAAYRATHRRRPIMDAFALHPYLIPSRLPPTFEHPNSTTIGIADYPKLVALLTRAFRGTAQRGETLPIVYDEFGYQSQIPASKRALYNHLSSPAARDAIPESRQAAYYREALALAACQPTVAGALIFHVVDERDARAWQSGVYYANGTPKSSRAAVRAAALAAQRGQGAGCAVAKTTDDVADVLFRAPSRDVPSMLESDFTCATPCSYRLRVVDASTGDVVAADAGTAVGPSFARVPVDGVPPGRYQYVLRVFKAGKPGTAATHISSPFTVVDPAAQPTVAQTPLLTAPVPTLAPVVPAW